MNIDDAITVIWPQTNSGVAIGDVLVVKRVEGDCATLHLVHRLQSTPLPQTTPPALGVTVAEGIDCEERIGG